MKVVLKGLAIAGVFFAIAMIIEELVSRIPGTPAHLFLTQLDAHRGDLEHWLGTGEAGVLMGRAAMLRYFLVLPAAALVTGFLGCCLSVGVRVTVVVVGLLAVGSAVVDILAAVAVSDVIRGLDAAGVGVAGDGDYLTSAGVRVVGVLVSAGAAALGYAAKR